MKRLVSLFIVAVCVLSVPISLTTVRAHAQEEGQARYAMDYEGGNRLDTAYRTVEYSSRVVDSYANPRKAPEWGASGKANSCVVDAGGNGIIYYDVFFDDLIPDYKHTYVWGVFTYGTCNDAVDAMFDSLYDLMGTTSAGTTVDGFKSGMTSYVSGRGHNAILTKATGSYHNLNLDYLKAQLDQDRMAVMFLSDFAIVSFSQLQNYEEEKYDQIAYYRYSGHHAVLVYGYHDIYYYDDNNNLIGQDTYLFASTGYTLVELSFIYVNDYGNIDDIYILNIV